MATSGGTRGNRVLCLDGGGIRGLIILEILKEIEKTANLKISEMFDWIGGTSTGGIIALGIATGKEIDQMIKMYADMKDKVFKGSKPYDSAKIEELFKQQFKNANGGDMVMTDIKGHNVVVTSVLGDHRPWELHLFRSYETEQDSVNRAPNDEGFKRIRPPNETYIWEVARSTSAAPTYFRPYKQFIDGGIMSNNPTLDMLTEIYEYYEHKEQKGGYVDWVVSIGCGYVDPVKQQVRKIHWPPIFSDIISLTKWLKSLMQMFWGLLAQATISNGQPSYRARAWCHMMRVMFFRFSPRLTKDVPLDCVDDEQIAQMRQEAKLYIAEGEQQALIQKLVQMTKRLQGDEPKDDQTDGGGAGASGNAGKNIENCYNKHTAEHNHDGNNDDNDESKDWQYRKTILDKWFVPNPRRCKESIQFIDNFGEHYINSKLTSNTLADSSGESVIDSSRPMAQSYIDDQEQKNKITQVAAMPWRGKLQEDEIEDEPNDDRNDGRKNFDITSGMTELTEDIAFPRPLGDDDPDNAFADSSGESFIDFVRAYLEDAIFV